MFPVVSRLVIVGIQQAFQDLDRLGRDEVFVTGCDVASTRIAHDVPLASDLGQNLVESGPRIGRFLF